MEDRERAKPKLILLQGYNKLMLLWTKAFDLQRIIVLNDIHAHGVHPAEQNVPAEEERRQSRVSGGHALCS
jgi:hypothetical protein